MKTRSTPTFCLATVVAWSDSLLMLCKHDAYQTCQRAESCNKICLIEQVHSRLVYCQDCNCGSLNMLSSIIANFEPIRRNILQMLKPTDIVALWMATKLIITQSEKRAYLSWTREVFEGQCKLNQLLSDGCAITVVGKTWILSPKPWDRGIIDRVA